MNTHPVAPNLLDSFNALLSTDELIDWLDSYYPEKCPAFEDQERDIWFYAGKRELVKSLRILQEARDAEVAEQNAMNASII